MSNQNNLIVIDTHAHLYATEYENDIKEVVARAKQSGVIKVLLPNIDTHTIEILHLLYDEYPDFFLPMMGLHPTSIDKNWEKDLKTIKNLLEQNKYIAIGEIGIDLYWDKTFEEEQINAFTEQLKWSIEYDLPVSIHSRNANSTVLKCIKSVGAEKLKGVFHSFGGDVEELREILKLNNFLLGINGVVTYKNSTLPNVLKETNLSHLVIETDSPYLPPVPYRGKRNESSYTTLIVNKLAEIYSTTPEEVGRITTENAVRLFNIKI